jgi:hypothetical protein
MGYVVKAMSASGCKLWIQPVTQKHHRNFGPRKDAEVFRTQKDAQAIIDRLPPSFRQIGFEFEVESSNSEEARSSTADRRPSLR